MSLLLLFQNIRILLTQRGLAMHWLGRVGEVSVLAGGENRLHYLGSVTELNVL